MWEKVSHPYKTTDKILVKYFLNDVLSIA
jgi:hypothetical protein